MAQPHFMPTTTLRGRPTHGSIARRCAPTDPVSLPAQKKLKVSHVYGINSDLLAAARRTHLRHESSGQSDSDLSGSRWYDNANRNISQSMHDAADYNTDPPFYLSNVERYPSQIQLSSTGERLFGVVTRADSENEDLRDVIDDLTIENKKLKNILRGRRGRWSTRTSGEDKLFEVRMHGLPTERKRELEALLKNFASSMQSGLGTGGKSGAIRVSGNQDRDGFSSVGLAPNVDLKRLPTDSGYGSNSGNASVTPSHSGRTEAPVSRDSKVKSVTTYLQGVPDVLLPRCPPVMSERSRMALVVRRLEQLFTGKTAVPGEHSQPIQQQEISHSAARADQQEDLKNNRRLRAEGPREAYILPHESHNLEEPERQQNSPSKVEDGKEKSDALSQSSAQATDSGLSRSLSPDQRPTRPLDLDIERQVTASENIDYIRHLGLSTTTVRHTDVNDEEWIYLNLLTGMAQLHTINVTPGFVRKAIRKRSSKFELSNDGHKVRWIGGTDITIFSTEEERVLEGMNAAPPTSIDGLGTGSATSKRSKTTSSSNAFISAPPSENPHRGPQISITSEQFRLKDMAPRRITGAAKVAIKPGSAFDYKPIIFKGKSPVSSDDSIHDTSSSNNERVGIDPTGLAQALSKSHLNRQRADDGAITFYSNNPYFCSDFSGDSTPLKTEFQVPYGLYRTLGIPVSGESAEDPLRSHDACYFTPQFAVRGFEGTDEELRSFNSAPMSSAGQFEAWPIDLAASGLGGVTPEDNFAVDVKIERRESNSVGYRGRKRSFTNSLARPRFGYRLLEARRTDLQPSRLPPPSYAVFNSSSSSDAFGTMDLSDDPDAGSYFDEEFQPPSFLRHLTTEGSRTQETIDSSDHDDEEEEDDDSIDMSGTERNIDPQDVAAREREYAMTQQEAASGVPGSLAVTVGTRTCSVSGPSEVTSDTKQDRSESELGATSEWNE